MTNATTPSNDRTIREAIWRRFPGDEWAAFDQLPAPIRHRLAQHAYDAWSVNALILWRHYRRIHPTAERAVRALLRYLDHCERLERRAFAATYTHRHGTALPHEAANIPVLRSTTSPPLDPTPSPAHGPRHRPPRPRQRNPARPPPAPPRSRRPDP